MGILLFWVPLGILSTFLAQNTGGVKIPQYLLKKYGNQFTIPGGNGPLFDYKNYSKTKTKSPYPGKGYSSVTKYPFGTNTYYSSNKFGGCAQPPPLVNAGITCHAGGTCQASCVPNYQFPDGRTKLVMTCQGGEWKTDGMASLMLSCQPICLPPCRNNGICIAPNQCHCPRSYSGAQCQFENKPCLNYPPIPMNSRRTCRTNQCTIQCARGHEFPDGSSIATMVCKNGLWLPAKQKWVSIPDCKATCDPPCLNGGNCLSFNVCQCPQGYRGPQCQYSVDACSAKKLPFNGGYNCSGDADSFSCSIFCPEEIQFEFQPESVYTCHYSTGIFRPTPIPKCVYPGNVYVKPQPEEHSPRKNGTDFGPDRPYLFTLPDLDYYGSTPDYGKGGGPVAVEEKLPKPGSCFHWGGTHYKTFDGNVYSFDSKCAYVLVRDAVDNTFSIITENNEDCNYDPIHCHKVINIYLQDKQYFLKRSPEGIPIFSSNSKVLPIPGQVPGIRVEMSAHYIVVSLDSLGVKVRWDGLQLVHVEVKENLWNRTEGLCGKIDDDPRNDLTTPDGRTPNSIGNFATSYKIDSLGGTCDDVPVEEHVCQDTGVKGSLAYKATLFCKKVLADRRFSPCQRVVDITSLFEACRWDYCSCKQNDRTLCPCETLNVYVRDCSHKGVTGLANWRDADTCPMQCTGGKVYKACGSPKGQPGCGAINEAPTENEPCVEGCFCPEGTVLHADKCITKDKCPCGLRGKSFPPEASVPKDCNTCTCSEGQWVCTQVTCGARCSAVGDPHYVTFDGKKFDFMGQCSYYLVKTDNFSIEAENVACAGSISQAMNFPTSISSGLPSCTKAVTIKINGQVIKLKQNHDIVVNGQDISKVPYSIAGISIRSASSIFLTAKLPNGIEVWWDGVNRAYIDVPAEFKDKTKGLCGTFNDHQKDDFLTPEDDVEQAVIPFANKWKTSEKCNDIPDVLPTHPCDKNIHKKAEAEQHCSKIKSDLFKDCHWFVEQDQFYQDCLYDMCSCEFTVSKCLCPIMASYATECSRKGVKIDWRKNVRECGIHCPGDQKYQVCGNSCTRTCFDIATNPNCKQICVEGCNCPEGQALNDDGECILIGQCKCQYDGLEFPAGYKEIRPAPNGPELCTCVNAIWQCRLATPTEVVTYPRADDLKSMCNASENKEFTSCEPAEPITCRNMHAPEYFSASVCHPGCQCKQGHVLDTKSKRCVKPTECPCHHGGKSYGEKATVQSDCNTCECRNGKWKCTDRQCSAECSAWGDSHYKTFDGKHFDYQGQCDYILAKGVLGSDSFDITIQNVPCGSLGTACSKSVTVRVSSGEESESIELAKDKPLPRYKTYQHITVREKGLYVIVEAPDLGLVVHWDKGTRVYVKVNPRWKDQIKGLCGNYNDNELDDFQTPSGGLAEVSANTFGDSWRLQSYCPEAYEVADTCEDRPDRKVWAVKQCGIMKSPLFASCHSEVPLDYYYEKCVFDSCACDQGGDCECLCTALAAYAQECNNRGVPVKWRSQKLCPMQCDVRCTTYSPCVQTCPEETCDSLLINTKLSKSCAEDTCIEGCSPKPCPPGHVYLNSSLLDCVPRNICKPVCLEEDGITYYEGDLMEQDECHSCYCSREQKICRGQPCPITSKEKFTTPQKESVAQCKSGWTTWINQDRTVSKTKTGNKRKDVEPLPKPVLLNNLKESSRCDINQMVDIECRTVKTHVPAKATGLNVECSLQNGLICKSGKGKWCPDFEIRVLCRCEEASTTPMVPGLGCNFSTPNVEHPTDCHKFLECAPGLNGNELVEKTCGNDMMYNPNTMTCDWPEAVIAIKESCGQEPPVEPELPVCPPGMVQDSCAIQCDKLCIYYSYIVKQKGLCQNGARCESGCVSTENRPSCPGGMLWANDHTCVSADECQCVSDEGIPIRPGQVYEEGYCKKCQCIDNFYSCESDYCTTTAKPPEEYTTTEKVIPTLPTILIPSSVTPPPKCDEDRFMDLIQGDQPLPDEAFNASSILSPSFAPSHARFNSRVTEKSGGSWAPKYSNQDQYLEIDLGRQEPLYGVVVRGSPLYDEYVTSYKVLYSPDGHVFYYILNNKNYPTIFRGSIDTTTPVRQVFDTPVEAKVIRINPQTWNNGISLRVELIGCAEQKTTTPPYGVTTGEVPPVIPQYCDDAMGFSDGTMSDQQVSTSSELSPAHGKKYLKLNSDSSWQPLINSPTEWIQFDFLELRTITAVVTRGGEDGWVTAYAVRYSHDKKHWNRVLDETRQEKIFLGNYDGVSPQVNNFVLPISARYVRIIPTRWHHDIQMRAEIHGCFKPYPPLEVLTTLVPPSACNICPGVIALELEMEACRCLSDLWWDGENCVNRTRCPCMVGHIPYTVGAVFEQEDCSECICKLGGVSHCTPKKCDECREGLRSTVTSTCACTCQPCPENTLLCPTSNICINSTLWCNGVQECPDDETDCPITPEVTTPPTITTTKKPVITRKCPVVQCAPGYKKVLRKVSKSVLYHSYLSRMISGQSFAKKKYSSYAGVKSGYKTKGGYKQQNLQRPLPVLSDLAQQEQVCKEYKCISTKPPPVYIHSKDECPAASCQENYIPVYEPSPVKKSKVCPTYACYPPPESEAVCNVTGRTFNTFDNVEYKYDICYHLLARDLETNEWDVSLKKNCTKSCAYNLIIRHQDNVFVLYPDLSLEFDGYKYSVEQTKSIGSQNQAFSIYKLGNTLLFTSNRYGFWIIWNTREDVKLGVVYKLAGKVDGLCGYFNDNPNDDKRKPDGSVGRTSMEFGDSWALSSDQPLTCEAKVCPLHIQNKAWEMCNKVKEQSLSLCARVVDLEAFISRCLETTCTCLQQSLDNPTAEEECRCQSMQAFVVDCLSADSTIDLSDWRMQQDCPTVCEAPLVYYDCYQRKCEPTCESMSDPNVCPKINNMCFPGCYCPPGYVRKGETCIKPSSCRDCECNVLPHLQYVTYDENNFTISGNCVYVMSRDVLMQEEEEHKFQVLVTNHPCKNSNDKMCVGNVTILYEDHKIHVLLDEYGNKLKLIVDGEWITDFDEISPWSVIRETATKHFKILLTAAQVEVSVYFPSLGVSVKAPSHKYGGRLEGLCGDCNGDLEDDFRTPAGTKPRDVNNLGLSWLYEGLPGGQNKEQCNNRVEEVCPPLPVDSDPCVELVDVNIFGQCLNVLDPVLFINWCQKDTCGAHPEFACTAIEAYARDCASAGFCINWRNDNCPAKGCPPDQFYDPCGTNSPETCEIIKGKTKVAKTIIPTEGCYCPEGKVFLDDTCVVPNDCEVCDEAGHHPGDSWRQDKCTTCTCEGTSLKCETQHCPGISTICESGYNAIKLTSNAEECCDKYACVPEATPGPTCETPQNLVCGPGQVMKLYSKPNGCQTFICECIPTEDCEALDVTTEAPLGPGYVREIDDSGCCPVFKLVCIEEECPKPIECPKYFSLKAEHIPGDCCPFYLCEPPANKCIYETQYTAAPKGGARLLRRFERQTVLKGANETWRDGPCRDCKCALTSVGNYQPICSQTECPSIKIHSDYADYKLQLEPVFEQCCPDIKRVGCMDHGKAYDVGEKWPKGADYCTVIECVDTPTGIQKETQVKSCDQNCDLGFEYIEPRPDLKECCGSCKQVACVAEGVLHEMGEQWTSDDHCLNFFCININGSLQVQGIVETCPELPEEFADEFVIETLSAEGKCCETHVATACKVGDKIYQVGQSWPPTDGDKCKTVTCVEKENKELVKQESIETCKTDCAKGWEYKESNNACCGECVQTACVVDGEIKEQYENWTSADNCTTFTCDNLGDQFVVTSQQESCPSLEYCPEENIYDDGCCKHCNLTVLDLTVCSPKEIPLDETIKMLNYSLTLHGHCTNLQPVSGFTECIGSCHSSTFFNTKSGMHESVCSCCQATEYNSIYVELECADGETFKKKVAVPSKCGCEGCAANKSSLTKSPIKGSVKTARTV